MTASQLLPLILSAGLLDSINPCAFSILFLTIAFLFSIKKNRRFVLLVGAIYIFGIAVTYTLIGLGTLTVLDFFNVPNGLAKFGALALVMFSLVNIINEFIPSFPIKLKMPEMSHPTIAKFIERASIPSAFVLGVLVGLFEFPCTGGPYLFILGLLHDNATRMTGFWYLITYNFVFVLPLIVILLLCTNRRVADKIDMWRRGATKRSRVVVSLLMMALGLIIFLI